MQEAIAQLDGLRKRKGPGVPFWGPSLALWDALRRLHIQRGAAWPS